MILLISIIVAIIIVSSGFIFYLVSKQKEEFNFLLKEDIVGKKLKKESEMYSLDLMSNNKFDKLLSESKNKPDDLEILEKDIQNRLGKFVKISDLEKARQCNEQLKKINLARKKEI